MLDSLYGDLPPPSGEEGSSSVSTSNVSKNTSLLGSLYDDLDDPAPAEPSVSSALSSSATSSPPCSSMSSSWTAQRLQLLTPAVVRKQTLAAKSSSVSTSSASSSTATAAPGKTTKAPLDVAAVAAAASAAAAAVAAQLKAVKTEALIGSSRQGSSSSTGEATDTAVAAAGSVGASKHGSTVRAESVFSVGTVGNAAGVGGIIPVSRDEQNDDRGQSGMLVTEEMKDEYDPAMPNDYGLVYRERIRKQQREELERLRQQELEKQRREREASSVPPSSGSSLSGVAFADSPAAPVAPPAPPAPPALPSYIDPAKKSFAARMMEKMGWKHGEGLGVNKQGITAPLVAKKTAMRSGVIVQVKFATLWCVLVRLSRMELVDAGVAIHGSKWAFRALEALQFFKHEGRPAAAQGTEVVTAAAQVRAQFNRPPTRVLLLLNMVGRGEVDDDLKEETEEEAAKFGNLLQVKIVEASDAPDEEAVRIFCEYERKEEATRALLTMNGRVFGGRTVKGRFYCEERWSKDDLQPNAEEEADKPLD